MNKFDLPVWKLSLFAIVLILSCKPDIAQKARINNSIDKHTGTETTYLPDTTDTYPGCKFKGNYIYAAAVNLLWNDIKKNITGEEIKLKTEDNNVQHFISLMNRFLFSAMDLDSNSYYVKSGFGQQALDLINKQVKSRFPEKSFPELKFPLKPNDLISYAYLYKNVQYVNKFSPRAFSFEGQWVKGFFAGSPEQKNEIEILRYWSNDKFIIRLKLKNPEDELVLAKGFNQKNPIEIMENLNKEERPEAPSPIKEDIFEMPEVHFQYSHSYIDMIGLEFLNQKLRDQIILVVNERVNFDLDYNGVRLENDVVMVGGGGGWPRVNRLFILDKPFWVIMKKKSSHNPYFILGVNNTEIMSKVNRR